MAGAGENFADGAAGDARLRLITATEALEEDADASGMHDVVVEEAGEAWTKEPIKERPRQSTYSGAGTKPEPGGPSPCARRRKRSQRAPGAPSRRAPAASPARALRLLACHYYYASVYVVAGTSIRTHDYFLANYPKLRSQWTLAKRYMHIIQT